MPDLRTYTTEELLAMGADPAVVVTDDPGDAVLEAEAAGGLDDRAANLSVDQR